MSNQVDGLARGDDDQQSPQVVPVFQPRKPPLLGAATEAVEGRQRHVFLVGCPPGQVAQLLACQADQAAVVVLPQLLHGRAVAGLQLTNPVRDVSVGRHRGCSC
jgi:hypothetical protein